MQKPSTKVKRKVAKATGIPTTSSGRKRKAQKAATGGGCLIPIIVVILIICITVVAGCSDVSSNKLEATTITTAKVTEELVTEEVTSHNDTIDGYKFAEHKTYNSPAEENGLGGEKIYFDGMVTRIDTASDFIYGIVKASDGEWLVLIGSSQIEDISNISSLYLEKSIRVFGTYRGFSEVEKKPAVLAEIITCNGQTQSYNQLSDFIKLDNQSQTETSSEKPVSKESVIFDNMGIVITSTGITKSSYDTKVDLRIENNSGYDFDFQARDTSVNGYMISPVFSCKVKNGKIANTGLVFSNSKLEDNGINEIENVELSIHAFNWDDDSHNFDSEMITFNP